MVGEKGEYDVATRQELENSELGKEAITLADETKVPIAVVKQKDPNLETQDVAWYDAKNGVIYINKDAKVSKETLRKEVRKHELVHAIAKNNRKLYNEIKDLVDEVIDIKISPETGEVSFEIKKGYNNGALSKYLESSNLGKKLTASFADISKTFGERVSRLRSEIGIADSEGKENIKKALEGELKKLTAMIRSRLQEEVVAYFVETMVGDTRDFLSALEGKDLTFFERFADFFDSFKDDKAFEQFGSIGEKAKQQIRKITRKVSEGTREVARSRDSLAYFYRNFFGAETKITSGIAPNILNKFGAKKIIEAIYKASREGKGLSSIEIDGETLSLSDIFIRGENDIPAIKKVDFNKRDEKVEFAKNWSFSDEKVKNGLYKRALDSYIEGLEAEIEDISLSLSDLDRKERTYTKKDGTTYISSEYEEGRKRKTILQNRVLATRLLAEDISMGVGINNNSNYNTTQTVSEIAQANNITLPNQSVLANAIRDGRTMYGRVFAQTNIKEVSLSAENKRNLLLSAEFDFQETALQIEKTKAFEKVKQETPQVVKDIKSASLSLGKKVLNWIEKYVPAAFGKDVGFQNKGFSTRSIQEPRGVVGLLDFTEQFNKLQTKKEQEDSMNEKVIQITALYNSFLGQTITTQSNKKQTLGIENFNVKVDVAENLQRNLSVIRVEVSPTQEALQKAVDELVKEREKPEVQEVETPVEQEPIKVDEKQKATIDEVFKNIDLNNVVGDIFVLSNANNQEVLKAKQDEINAQRTTEGLGALSFKELAQVVVEPTISTEATQLVSTEETIAFQKFDPQSKAVIFPFYEQKLVAESIKKASAVSPVVVLIVPANWAKSLELQKNIPNNLKIVQIVRVGETRMKINEQGKTEVVNAVSLTLVDKTNEEFIESSDLRETTKTLARFQTDDLILRTLNKRGEVEDARVFEAFKNPDGSTQITLAVPFTGNNVDFSQRYTNVNDIPKFGRFILVRAISPEAEQIVKDIDYKKLAENSFAFSGQGFLSRDIIEEYNARKNQVNTLDDSLEGGVFKKVSPKTNLSPTTVEQRRQIMTIFDDTIVREMFDVDKNGNLVLRAIKIPEKRGYKNEIKINGVNFSGEKYALNTSVQLPEIVGSGSFAQDVNENKIAQLSQIESNAGLKAVYDLFVASKIPFVMVNDPTSSSRGFFYPIKDAYVVFINVGRALTPQLLTMVLVHELFHNLFKNESASAQEVSAQLALMLFEKDPTTNTMGMSQAGKVFFDRFEGAPSISPNQYESYGFNLFLSRLQSIDSYKFMRKVGRDAQEIFNILSTPNATLVANATSPEEAIQLIKAKNEVSAQIAGFLFSDFEVFKKFFEVDESLRIPMFQMYSKFMTDGGKTSTQASKNFMRVALQNYVEGFNNLIESLKVRYPQADIIIQKDINEFIKLFTDGKYTKKIDLISAYLKERDNKTRGEATKTLDKIIFLASIFAKSVQTASESFNQIVNELNSLIGNANYLLNLKQTQVPQIANQDQVDSVIEVGKVLKRFVELTKDGKLDINRANPTQDETKDFPIEEEIIETTKDNLEDFLEFYENLDPRIISMFGLPTFDVIEDSINKFLNDLDRSVTKPFAKGVWNQTNSILVATLYAQFNEKVLKPLQPYFSITNILAKRVSLDTPQGVLAGIIGLRTDIQIKNIEMLTMVLANKVKSAVQSILNAPLQSKSPVSVEIAEMNVLVGKMIDITKDTTKDVQVMAQELALVLSEIIDLANLTIARDYLTTEEYETILKNKATFKIDANNFPPEVFESVKERIDLIEKLVVKVYKQLALFGTDNSLLFNVKYLTSGQALDLAGSIKPTDEFSPAYFADAISKIIKTFATRYTSSLSDDKLTHNEYAIEVAKEIDNFKKTKQKINTSTDKLNQVQTPQDFFKKMINIFSGKVSLFEKIWDAYRLAVARAQKIVADFHKEYTSFNQKNKGLQEYSYKEKVEIDSDYLISMTEDDLRDLRIEVTKEMEEMKRQVGDITKQIDDNKKNRQPLNDQIKKLEQEKKAYQQGSYQWKTVQAKIRALKTQRQPLLDEFKKLRGEKKAIKGKLGDLSSDERLKIKIVEFLSKPENQQGREQTMTHGEIISLYLSVSREIEMAEIEKFSLERGEVNFINPTNHFRFGNQINVFNNELLRNKGYTVASKRTNPFTIFTLDKQELKNYLETLLTDKDRIIMDFAKDRFDQNYELLNEEFQKRFKVQLPRQTIYIPFATVESEYGRETDIKLRMSGKYNIGVAEGLVSETTTGANTPLKIENIFGVLENHTRSTSRFSYQRLLKDWQNLKVNKSYFKVPLQQTITGTGNWLGTENNFSDYFDQMFVDILGYNDINDAALEKFFKWAIRQNRVVRLSFGIWTALRQLGSISTIAIKNKQNFFLMVKNLLASGVFKDKYYKYLMNNNPEFYLRVISGSIPDLARAIDTSLVVRTTKIIDRINEVGSMPSALMDTAVLVSAFRTIAEEIRKKNPTFTEDQVLEEANKRMEDVFLYGVASTNRAYRSHFSNSKSALVQLASRFQSENVLQWSSIITAWHGIQNNVSGAKEELLRAILSLLLSSFYGAAVSTGSAMAMGYTNADDALFEFLVNNFVWGNVVGSMPMFNQITSLLQFDQDTVVRVGFEPQLPFIGELVNIVEQFSYGLINGNTGEFNYRRALRILNEVLTPFGVPAKKIEEIFKLTFNIGSLFGDKTSSDVSQWFAGQTDAQALTKAVTDRNKSAVNSYVDEVFSNSRVQNEIVGLLLSDNSFRISLFNEDTFIDVQKDGSRKIVKIPPMVKSKYRRLQMNAIMKLISKGKYRSLSKKQKLQSIQRIISYYYNYMKAFILRDKKDIIGSEGIDQVVERALQYED